MKNKHSLCPLCGGEPDRFLSVLMRGVYSYGCPDCGLTTLWGAGLDWSAWEELVSKFPPVLRLREGDTVQLCNSDIVTVSEVDTKMCCFNTMGGNVWLGGQTVLKWPWEFEQEGGEQ